MTSPNPLDPARCRDLVNSERFVSKTKAGPWPAKWHGDRPPVAPCRLWTAGEVRGYGRVILSGGVRALAHRVALVAHLGRDLEGDVVDHLCETPACLEPAHLADTTQRANVLAGRAPAAGNARRTRCPLGHALAEPNLGGNARRGRGRCLACAISADEARAARCRAVCGDLGITRRDHATRYGTGRQAAIDVLGQARVERVEAEARARRLEGPDIVEMIEAAERAIGAEVEGEAA